MVGEDLMVEDFEDEIILTNDTAEQLYKLLKREYISYEFHPLVIELLEVLSKKFHPDRQNER